MIALLLFVPLLAPTPVQDAEPKEVVPTHDWHSIESAAIEGRGWDELASPYDRLPAKAEGIVREPVWKLQRKSSGICARFVTDSKEIRARWTLTSAELDMTHMPASGVSGVDLYGRDEAGTWRWVGATRPENQQAETTIVSGLDGAKREYLLYLPLYNGVTSVEVGLPKGASFAAGPARPEGRKKPIVFYGTSITQGGCASRAGMTHAAQLGRRLDRPFINLGFSGNGRMDLELAPIFGELDAALFVIDCLPNMGANAVTKKTVPFVTALREARPGVPILLVEDRSFTNTPFRRSRRQHHEASRRALRLGFEKLIAGGMERLHYLEGANLLGHDGEATVDGSHPTDLGFVRQADVFEPRLREIIGQPRPLRVLLLGDSISIGYTPHVRKALRGEAIVVRAIRGQDHRATENCEGTTKGVKELDRWLALDGGDWDVIHFNFGMHDLKRVQPDSGKNSNNPKHPHQAGPAQYEANLREIVARLQKTGARLIFATSTPVPEGGVRPHRDPLDAVRFNQIACDLMAEVGIEVNDLFQLVEDDERALQRPVDVHFTSEGSKALAKAVVHAILNESTAK